ncbi:MAG: Rid family detoxifying hydrolase [Bacillota bacterium]|nr:Rid family detoxifying hydrolase [Bacillota bacterium]
MKSVISTELAPAAIGPYSQAVQANGFVFTSGQLPLCPDTGQMPETIEEQTKQSLTNVEAILQAAGVTKFDVVKTTVFLKNMGDFAAMNAVYEAFFAGAAFPARSAVEVARLPKDALVEIEVVARCKP